MSEPQPSITASSSSANLPFPPTSPLGSSAAITESDATAQLLDFRRRFSSDSNFFTDAAASFQPKPYNPNGASNFSRTTSSSSIGTSRSRSSHDLSLSMHPAGMDPSPSDPGAFFIHPPFDVFPGAEDHPGGLTYLLIASQPEWFLDPNDFIFPGSTNPNAIPYPTKLEPPRGWCPARKRDLEKSGKDGWPIGEEPRLRCTFCRRTYAGVNAKSMWRRHVFEKHKIAMSNRRDGGEKSGRGGRGAKSSSQSTSPQPTTKAEEETMSENGTETKSQSDGDEQAPAPKRTRLRNQPSRKKSSEVSQKDLPHPLSQSTLPPISPPPTPTPTFQPVLTEETYTAPDGVSAQELEAAQQLIAVASTPVPQRFLASHDVTSTPSFRLNDSPLGRGRNDMWRMSPNDPRQKMMLTTLNAGVSPSYHNAVGTPESMERFKPSPRSLFGSKSRLSLADRLNDSPFSDSPLSRSIRQPHLYTPGASSSKDPSWFGSSSDANDPFTEFNWPKMGMDDMLRSPPMSGFNSSPIKGVMSTPFKDLLGLTNAAMSVDLGEESPVVRRTIKETPTKSTGGGVELGLGIGLMEPFTLSASAKKEKKEKEKKEGTHSTDSDVDAEFPPIKDDKQSKSASEKDSKVEMNGQKGKNDIHEDSGDGEEEDDASTLVASSSSKASLRDDMEDMIAPPAKRRKISLVS